MKSNNITSDLSTDEQKTEKTEQKFLNSGLLTNTSISSIDQSLVFGWGPAKDGIPAINNPKFLSVSEAKDELDYFTKELKTLKSAIKQTRV